MNTPFSNSSMIRSGWTTFKHHLEFLLVAGVATFVLNIILRIIQNRAQLVLQTPEAFGASGIILAIIGFVIVILGGIIISFGWSQVSLKLVRHDSADWNDFKTRSSLWVRAIKTGLWLVLYLIAFILVPFIVVGILITIGILAQTAFFFAIAGIIGFASFTVIAIYFAVRYQFISYVILDNPGLKSHDVFKKAGAMTKGNFWKLLGFGIICGLVNLLGLLCIGIGLLATMPTTKVAAAKVYELLKHNHQS